MRIHPGQVPTCSPPDPLIAANPLFLVFTRMRLLIDQTAFQASKNDLVFWSREEDQAVPGHAILRSRWAYHSMDVGTQDSGCKLYQGVAEIDYCFTRDGLDPDPSGFCGVVIIVISTIGLTLDCTAIGLSSAIPIYSDRQITLRQPDLQPTQPKEQNRQSTEIGMLPRSRRTEVEGRSRSTVEPHMVSRLGMELV